MSILDWFICHECEYHFEELAPVYSCPACGSEDIDEEELDE